MRVTDPAAAFFSWRAAHPHQSEDMSAVWGAAWRAGGRAALHDSSRLAGLLTLLQELLYALEDGRVELEFRDLSIDVVYEKAHADWQSLRPDDEGYPF